MDSDDYLPVYSHVDHKYKEKPCCDPTDPCFCNGPDATKCSKCWYHFYIPLQNWCINTICCPCFTGCQFCCSTKEYTIFKP